MQTCYSDSEHAFVSTDLKAAFLNFLPLEDRRIPKPAHRQAAFDILWPLWNFQYVMCYLLLSHNKVNK